MVILGPYEPIAGYKVAAIVDGGIAIELVETSLSGEEHWPKAKRSSILHADDNSAKRRPSWRRKVGSEVWRVEHHHRW
jgi:hypothetical protein